MRGNVAANDEISPDRGYGGQPEILLVSGFVVPAQGTVYPNDWPNFQAVAIGDSRRAFSDKESTYEPPAHIRPRRPPTNRQ